MNVQQTVPLLIVADLTASLAFYRDGLGFEVREAWEPDGKLAWCWLARGGAALMLQQACAEAPPAAERGKGVTLYFICEDASAFYREVSARQVQATEPAVAFYGMNQTFLSDPDGYQLCFENREKR